MEEVASTVRTGDFGEKTGRERAAKARESSPGSISSVGAREALRKPGTEGPQRGRPAGEPGDVLGPSTLRISSEHQRLLCGRKERARGIR